MSWTPDSWQSKPVKQMPTYPDQEALQQTLGRLSKLPPLVTSWEIESLKGQLAEVAAGKRFVLQGGDCSENFEECESSNIAGKLKILLQMSLLLIQGSRRRVTRIGRFAGQYAKPRSSDTEVRDGVELPSYRGDIVNAIAFTAESRVPNPERLLRGYERAALTLNFIRSLVDGGFADLHHPENWNLGFVEKSSDAAEYQKQIANIADSVDFVELLTGARISDVDRVEFFTGHEGLHLFYEQAQTRQVPSRTGWYNLSTHFPWIGDRTRSLNGAHVEYFRGIENPIGVKIGPSIEPDELVEMLTILNPKREVGRVTLIHRFGTTKIADHLPALLQAVEQSGEKVIWVCDPMHGNTETQEGYKTRDFQNILGELEQAFDIHKRHGTYLGGLHLELTGEDVTECTGGARNIDVAELKRNYKTQVDPRLNYEQALEIALLVAKQMNGG